MLIGNGDGSFRRISPPRAVCPVPTRDRAFFGAAVCGASLSSESLFRAANFSPDYAGFEMTPLDFRQKGLVKYLFVISAKAEIHVS